MASKRGYYDFFFQKNQKTVAVSIDKNDIIDSGLYLVTHIARTHVALWEEKNDKIFFETFTTHCRMAL